MSALANLKFVAARKSRAANPVVQRRMKLCAKLQEQLELCTAQQTGAVYTAKRLRTVVDAATGAKTVVEVQRRVREWYWTAETGKVHLSVRYGASTLTLAKGGKNAIEVNSKAELIDTLKVLMAATANGELDEAIAEVSVRTRKAFGK
jgi:hypothetical protein